MDEAQAAEQLSALSHETRLKVFRALVAAGPDGVPAGRLADRLGVAPNTLSAHLNILLQSRLADVRRQGRMRVYSASMTQTSKLLHFLIADCCGGHPETCSSTLRDLGFSDVETSC